MAWLGSEGGTGPALSEILAEEGPRVDAAELLRALRAARGWSVLKPACDTVRGAVRLDRPALAATALERLSRNKYHFYAFRLFYELRAARVLPARGMYGPLLRGQALCGVPTRGRAPLVVALLLEMRDTLGTVPQECYEDAAVVLAHEAERQRLDALLADMQANATGPGPGALSRMISACSASGSFDLAYSLFLEHAGRKASDPRLGRALLHAALASCSVERAVAVMGDLRATYGFAPGLADYEAVLAACMAEGDTARTLDTASSLAPHLAAAADPQRANGSDEASAARHIAETGLVAAAREGDWVAWQRIHDAVPLSAPAASSTEGEAAVLAGSAVGAPEGEAGAAVLRALVDGVLAFPTSARANAEPLGSGDASRRRARSARAAAARFPLHCAGPVLAVLVDRGRWEDVMRVWARVDAAWTGASELQWPDIALSVPLACATTAAGHTGPDDAFAALMLRAEGALARLEASVARMEAGEGTVGGALVEGGDDSRGGAASGRGDEDEDEDEDEGEVEAPVPGPGWSAESVLAAASALLSARVEGRAARGEWAEAVACLDDAEEWGVAPSPEAATAAVRACLSAGREELAWSTFEALSASGSHGTPELYAELVEACEGAVGARRALLAADWMRAAGHSVERHGVLGGVHRAVEAGGGAREALLLLKWLHEVGEEAGEGAVVAALRACARDLAEAPLGEKGVRVDADRVVELVQTEAAAVAGAAPVEEAMRRVRRARAARESAGAT